jgi:hypothetical protein
VEDAASEPPAPVALAQKDALISGTELRRPLRSGDLASAPAIATRAGAITARGLLPATRVGNLAAAAARSIEAGEVEEAETWRRRDSACFRSSGSLIFEVEEFKGEETLLKLRFRANLLPVDVGITVHRISFQLAFKNLAGAQNSAGAVPVFWPIFVV